MSERISTKAGVFESGEKDAQGVQYNGVRLIACRNSKLTEYAVADGTEVICDRAFMNCKELKSVTLPTSVHAIGESAFSGCRALESINIPEGVAEIRQATFRECDALSALELPASCVEIDKYAMGRGLAFLAVNAPDMKIDRYAFMNATGFSMLICPAGSGDYYRNLLAEWRINAEVEETATEDKDNDLATIKNMEENKKTKTISINLFACEKFIDILDKDSDPLDAQSRFSAEDFMEWTVVEDGEYTEYKESDFGALGDLENEEEFYDNAAPALDVMEFIEGVEDADHAELNTLKSSGYMEIEIPADEHFDPKKFSIVAKDWIYPDYEEQMIYGVVYDGKFYDDLFPEDGRGVSNETIWRKDGDKADNSNTSSGISKEEAKSSIVSFLEKYYLNDDQPKEDDNLKNDETADDTNEDDQPEDYEYGWGYIDKTGKLIISPKRFDFAYPFSDGLAQVLINGKVGFIDKTGKYAIPPKYEEYCVGNFHEGVAQVYIEDKDKWGYIDTSGKWVIEPRFSYADDFENGLAVVGIKENEEKKYGFIDKNGDYVIEPVYEDANNFSEGVASVCIDGKWSFIDKTGAIILETEYDDLNDFSEGLCAVKANGKYGYIDKSGTLVIDTKFERAERFQEGLACVRVDGKYGFIDKTGTMIIDPELSIANGFSDGLAAVRLGKRGVYIDKTGAIALDSNFCDVNSFREGYARVMLAPATWGIIDKSGSLIIERPLEFADKFSEGLACISFKK